MCLDRSLESNPFFPPASNQSFSPSSSNKNEKKLHSLIDLRKWQAKEQQKWVYGQRATNYMTDLGQVIESHFPNR